MKHPTDEEIRKASITFFLEGNKHDNENHFESGAKWVRDQQPKYEEQIHDLKTELADYNASLHGWRASFEGERERHNHLKDEFEKLKVLANEYIDLLNKKESIIIELRRVAANRIIRPGGDAGL